MAGEKRHLALIKFEADVLQRVVAAGVALEDVAETNHRRKIQGTRCEKNIFIFLSSPLFPRPSYLRWAATRRRIRRHGSLAGRPAPRRRRCSESADRFFSRSQ